MIPEKKDSAKPSSSVESFFLFGTFFHSPFVLIWQLRREGRNLRTLTELNQYTIPHSALKKEAGDLHSLLPKCMSFSGFSLFSVSAVPLTGQATGLALKQANQNKFRQEFVPELLSSM